MTVLIAGGGIAGMTMALTCHQIGLSARVFESVDELKPLGVGINLQPNAVRELFELGLEEGLDEIGLEAQEWALLAMNGKDVWSETRGLSAGYRWPQYSVHRGRLQMLLYEAVVDRLGPDAVTTGHALTSYESRDGDIAAQFRTSDGQTVDETANLLIGADGLHSTVRSQMYPDQGEPRWGGAVMWRGTSQGIPIRTGNSFVLLGKLEHRFICYPISKPDPETGLSTINWIAERRFDAEQGWTKGDWNRQVDLEDFIEYFEDWIFDWLDVPGLIKESKAVLEYPMVDRDPVPSWVDGRAGLIGDAAHVMYPVGSNGASQAIVDTRILGAAFVEHGAGPTALNAYEGELLENISALVLRNRGDGPVGILGVVEERCGGTFDDIADVITREELDTFMANYKAAAGFAIETLNAAPPTIPPGVKATEAP